jgi:2-oxoisovalerate dehydrogenase E1 component alpha subunit
MSKEDPIRIIDHDGAVLDRDRLGGLDLKEDDLRQLYRFLVLARRADVETVALQRQGYLAVYGPAQGQEAASVGSAYALRPDDFMFPSYREIGAVIVRGVEVSKFLRYFQGAWHGGEHDVLKHSFGLVTVPVATHVPHAVGWAVGARLDGRDSCALAYFGDGATSKGDFHEGLNFAGVFRAPVLFFCQNNGWAISVPLVKQTAGLIWRRAEGYGFPGVLVDGNDVLGVYSVTKEAADRARSDHVPTLIEALTYRIGAHTTADDATRYRSADEVDEWSRRDPVKRYQRFLERESLADEVFVAGVDEEADRFVARLREEVVTAAPRGVEELFRWVFAEPTDELARQREEAQAVWAEEEADRSG